MGKFSGQDVLNQLTIHSELSSSELAGALGVSRQAAHARLRSMVESGQLEKSGKARATRYRIRGADLDSAGFEHSFAPEGLDEDLVWREIEPKVEALVQFSDIGRTRFRYAFTEMLNNAIDHAAATEVTVRFGTEVDEPSPGRLWFEVVDDGDGVFARIARELQLESPFESIIELSKGRFTTAPEAHSGEGIFFVSKVADRFELSSGGITWLVDNLLDDTAILEKEPNPSIDPDRPGTLVRFMADPISETRLEDLFAEYTEDYQFTKTKPVVKLVAYGKQLISRSEARRLLARLEQFTEVTLDFKGVEGVGQGFVDEVFRVFRSKNPNIELDAVNMNSAVEFMVRRGLS